MCRPFVLGSTTGINKRVLSQKENDWATFRNRLEPHYKAKTQPAKKTSPSTHPGAPLTAAPAVLAVLTGAALFVVVPPAVVDPVGAGVTVESIVGAVVSVAVVIDGAVLPEWEVGVVCAGVVTELDVLVAVVVKVLPPTDVRDLELLSLGPDVVVVADWPGQL